MELPESVVSHDYKCASWSTDDEPGWPCDCGAEQRAREDGAKWIEWAAEQLPPLGYGAIVNPGVKVLRRLAEQLRGRAMMNLPEIPDEAINAALDFLVQHSDPAAPVDAWKKAARGYVREALEAAYPAIRKAVLAEAADRLQERCVSHNYQVAIDDLRDMATGEQ